MLLKNYWKFRIYDGRDDGELEIVCAEHEPNRRESGYPHLWVPV